MEEYIHPSIKSSIVKATRGERGVHGEGRASGGYMEEAWRVKGGPIRVGRGRGVEYR